MLPGGLAVTTFNGHGRPVLPPAPAFKIYKGDVSHTVSLFFRANYVEQPATKPLKSFQNTKNPKTKRIQSTRSARVSISNIQLLGMARNCHRNVVVSRKKCSKITIFFSAGGFYL
jgi:hypothetical protein